MSVHPEDLIQQLAAVEIIAADILSDKQQIVDLDAKRNKCREAVRNLKTIQKSDENSKSWVCFGSTFLKFDSSSCIKMLESDKRTIDAEINQLRDGLKPKVSRLHEMEGRPEVKGFNLKGVKINDILHIT